MDRRTVLKGAGLAAAAGMASPALAQSLPEIRWRMPSSYPKSLDTLFGAGAQIAKRVAEATDNKFQIQVFAAGEIVQGLQVLDAVQNGTVECGYTLSSYYIGKDPDLHVRDLGCRGVSTCASTMRGCSSAAASR